MSILTCAVLLYAGGLQSALGASGLPGAANLAADALTVRQQRVPIVLFFNRDGCPYCERALREYMTPMQRDPDYASRAIFRQVEIDKRIPLTDFGGRAITHRELASRFKVTLTPTIWFVDGDGNALVPPIVGLPTLDFFQSYLDQSIADAQAKLTTHSR
ncbi:MAG: thioredoxin fold domain-containing protein [Casimicrobiaceae bacterium]